MDSCGRGTEYRHGKTYEECKQLAEDFTAKLKPKINEAVSYTHLTLPTICSV